MTNLYSLLNVPQDATKEQIKNAYESKKRLRTDSNSLFVINEAYALLMNDEKGIKYDSLLPSKNIITKKSQLV